MTEPTTDRNRSAYAALDTAFSRMGLGQQGSFLNWGYQPLETAEGEAVMGTRSTFERLVAELIGGERLAGLRLADIGCGRGGALDFIARIQRPLAMTGIDLSRDNIDSARALLAGRRVRLQVADACMLPLADASQDVVFNLESSGAYPDMVAFLRHVHRILAPGGLFLHGDLWPSELLEPFRDAMAAIGFDCVGFRDVTRQVCASREKMPASLIERLLGDDNADLRDYFAAPGSAMFDNLDSGRIAYVLTRWRKREQRQGLIDAEAINRRSGVIESLLQISRQALADREKWFPFGAPRRSAKVNVLAFPHAVAGASAFKSWGPVFPRDWRFAPVQLPGRESRMSEPPFTSLTDAVEAVRQLVWPLRDEPLVLVGWSLGSKLAFELAHRLEAEGIHPLMMVAGVCPGPHQPLPEIESFFGGHGVEARLRLLGGTPESILTSTEMLGALKATMEGDIAMAAGYRSEATVSTPMLAISASDDELVSWDGVESWRHRAAGEFEHVRLRGGHFLARDDGEKVARLIRTAIEARLAGQPLGTGANRAVA